MSVNFWNRYPFMEGFNKLPPWMWEPNSTNWWQVAVIYMLALATEAKCIVEIGVAEGYGSWFLSHAAARNGGEYVGIDIIDVWSNPHQNAPSIKTYFEGCRLPARFIQADTKLMTEIPIERIDMAFVDGEHSEEAVLHEVNNLIYPKTQKNGTSYIFLHDVVDFPGVRNAWQTLRKDPRFESMEFCWNYGFGILHVLPQGAV